MRAKATLKYLNEKLNPVIFTCGLILLLIVRYTGRLGAIAFLSGVIALFLVSFVRKKLFYFITALTLFAGIALIRGSEVYYNNIFEAIVYLILINLIFVIIEKTSESLLGINNKTTK